jgi:hypothetical protein
MLSGKIKENHVGLKLNGTHQLFIYPDDINLFGDNINIYHNREHRNPLTS